MHRTFYDRISEHSKALEDMDENNPSVKHILNHNRGGGASLLIQGGPAMEDKVQAELGGAKRPDQKENVQKINDMSSLNPSNPKGQDN